MGNWVSYDPDGMFCELISRKDDYQYISIIKGDEDAVFYDPAVIVVIIQLRIKNKHHWKKILVHKNNINMIYPTVKKIVKHRYDSRELKSFLQKAIIYVCVS